MLRKGVRLAPQLMMHAGFLLIALAHLLSAVGRFKGQLYLGVGGFRGFPDGERVRLEPISAETGAMGMQSAFGVQPEGGKGKAERGAPQSAAVS